MNFSRNWIPLNPPVPVETSRGYGMAWFLIDMGIEHNIEWFVACHDAPHTGQCWVVDNSEVRVCKNWTIKRGYGDQVDVRS